MEKILIEPTDKSKLKLVKSMLDAMKISFLVVAEDIEEKDRILSDIKEGYLEAKDMEEGKVEYKTYSSFSEMENDL
jgi:predicted transcriptional regulator